MGGITSVNGDGTPAGIIKYFANSSAPYGYLKANGAAISRTTYAALFNAIGTVYGAGDGSTTFNVPDLRGEFPRGFDDGRGVDSGRSIGSSQTDQFASHTHGNRVDRGSPSGLPASYIVGTPVANSSPGNQVSDAAGTGTETRPRNVALLACIKY